MLPKLDTKGLVGGDPTIGIDNDRLAHLAAWLRVVILSLNFSRRSL